MHASICTKMCYFIRIYQNRLHHNQSSENVGIMTHTNLLVELEGQHFAGPRRPLVCSQKSIDGVLARKLAESDVSISHHIIKRIKDVAMTSIPKAMPKDSESRKVPISKDSVRLGSQDTTPQNKNLSTHATSWDSYGWFDLTCDYNLPKKILASVPATFQWTLFYLTDFNGLMASTSWLPEIQNKSPFRQDRVYKLRIARWIVISDFGSTPNRCTKGEAFLVFLTHMLWPELAIFSTLSTLVCFYLQGVVLE